MYTHVRNSIFTADSHGFRNFLYTHRNLYANITRVRDIIYIPFDKQKVSVRAANDRRVLFRENRLCERFRFGKHTSFSIIGCPPSTFRIHSKLNPRYSFLPRWIVKCYLLPRRFVCASVSFASLFCVARHVRTAHNVECRRN